MIPHRHHSASAVTVSRSDLAIRQVGNVLYLDPRDAPRFQVWFRAAFAAWLRENFARPEQFSATFGVKRSTAYAWWNGENRPTGDAIARLVVAAPQVAAWFNDQWQRAA